MSSSSKSHTPRPQYSNLQNRQKQYHTAQNSIPRINRAAASTSAETPKYKKLCSPAGCVAVWVTLTAVAIFWAVFYFKADSYLPRSPSVSLHAISGSAIHDVSGDVYVVEDFAAAFRVHNNAKEGMIYTHNRVVVQQLKYNYKGAGSVYREFTSGDLQQPFEQDGKGSSLVWFAVPNVTIQIEKRLYQDQSNNNDTLVTAGISPLRLGLRSRMRYRGKAWPKEKSLESDCGESGVIAWVVFVPNTTRWFGLDFKAGNDCSHGRGDWEDTSALLLLCITLYSILVAMILYCTIVECCMPNGWDNPLFQQASMQV